MENGGGFFKNTQIIILGVCIAVATIVSSFILAQGSLKIMKFTREMITVTGSAQKIIRSDSIIWRCAFARSSADMTAAYQALEKDLKKVLDYLAAKGIAKDDITVAQVSITTVYKKNDKGNDTNEIYEYRLSQSVEVKSADVERVTTVSRESTELINQDIGFESNAPEYYYTKLHELKVDMVAQATENAKQRAQNMAKATGNRIGFMRSARMGVFQITPANSNDVTDYGMNDTSALDKKVTAVVTASFAIE
ncbi:MAG TPA: SIMPL domain-containing protein [bacterium]|nr:SIMPL domain-containing protein [bacterium]